MYDELIEELRLESVNMHYEKADCVLFAKAADAIEELEKSLAIALLEYQIANNKWLMTEEYAKQKQRWIPVTEHLPEEEESVLVVRKFLGLKGQVPPSTYVEIANRIGDRWISDSDEYKIARNRHTDPLYWMPLPQPPEEV